MSSRIMIVEDEGIVALDLEECLLDEGYDVCIAVSAREGAKKARTFRPELVVMDIDLQGPIDGIELVEQLQGTMNVSIVYLTAHREYATRARAEKTKPLGFLHKPFDVRTLKLSVEIALCKHELRCSANDAILPFVLDLRSLPRPLSLHQRCPLAQQCTSASSSREQLGRAV